MSHSRFAYVKTFELSDTLLPQTYLVVRLDGKGFSKFSTGKGFKKPNDEAALELMNCAAKSLMKHLGKENVMCAFGESDEYSFVISPSCSLFNRRERYFPTTPLLDDNSDLIPSFDGRIVQYPSRSIVIDYLKWRQVDTHINNLYNTTFWALVQRGKMTAKEAHAELSGTVSAQKNEILFSRFGINYNAEPEMFKKGSLLVWTNDNDDNEAVEADKSDSSEVTQTRVQGKNKNKSAKPTFSVVCVHEDMLKDEYWSNGRGKSLLG